MDQKRQGRRRRPRHPFMPVGAAWYTPRDWEVIKRAVPDPDCLKDSFEEWLQMAEHVEKLIADLGVVMERVVLDADRFLGWCEQAGVPPDASARSHYAALKVQERYAAKRPRGTSDPPQKP